VTHYGSFRRNRRIFHNAFRLTFEPPDFPRAIITTQIDPANAAIAAANFSSKEYQASYLDDDSYRLLCLRDRKVLRYPGIVDSLMSRRGERSRISISRISFSASPSVPSQRESTDVFCGWHPLNDAYVHLLFLLYNKPRERQHPIYSSERGICTGCLEPSDVLLTADPSIDLERFLSPNKKLSKQFLSN